MTISISIAPSTNNAQGNNSNNAVLKYEKKENGEGQYKITYENYEIGIITVDLTLTKVSDDAINSGKVKKCCEDTSLPCCDVCYNYVKEIYKTLKSMTELKMSTYTPYINSVTDHWYRNIYFTTESIRGYNSSLAERNEGLDDDDEKLEKEKHITTVDNKYAIETGERWTKYETDENGDYVLYVINEDTGKLTDNKLTKQKNGDYILSEDGITYRKVKKGEKGEYSLSGEATDNFRVAKKATDLLDVSGLSKTWKGAYSNKKTKVKTGWQILDPTDEDLEDMNDQVKKILTDYNDLTVVSTQEYETVEQVEDGVRGETNSKVKKIFLDNYYIYDGTTIRASQIQNAKNKTGSNDADKCPDTVVASYGTTDDVKKFVATKDDITGKINITRDSLNAFAILKNMRTLDAEYIYHDFKELIVELNYFDKEDLLEHGKQVMMFPIAGVNSTDWPVGGLDKYPTYYGTLIHSKADYEVLFNNEEVLRAQGKLDLKTNPEAENEELEYLRMGKGSSPKYHKDTFFETAEACWEYIVSKRASYSSQSEAVIPIKNSSTINDRLFVSWVLYEYGYDELKDSTGLGYGFFKTSTEPEIKYGFKVDLYSSGTEYIDELKKGDIISFGTGSSQDNGHIVIVASINLDDNGEKVVRAYDCSKAVDWTAGNAASGVDVTELVKGNKAGARVIKVDIDPVLTYDTGFEGGEPVVAPVSGQVIDYGYTSRKNVETGNVDEKTEDSDTSVGYIKIKILDGRDSPFCEEIKEPDGVGDSPSAFLKDKYTDEEIDKVGYDYFQEEYQNAGIAGDILYIEGFDISEILSKGESGSGGGEDDFSHTKPEDNTIRGGGENFVMDTTGLTTSQNISSKTRTVKTTRKGSKVVVNEENQDNIDKLSSYVNKYASNRYTTQYQVPSMQDKKAEFGVKVKEEAKKQAKFSITANGNIYIKEGAVIGFTYESDVKDGRSQKRDINYLRDGKVETDAGAGSVGNYLRIILRDLHDEVVENVEDYIEKGDQKPNYKITEKFMYWMAFTSEGALVPKDDQGKDENGEEKPKEYYASVDGNDGMGNSGPFGLTYCCKDAADSIGYTKFVEHQEDGKVPLVEAEDVFAAVLEAEKKEVLDGIEERDEKLLKRTSDYMFLALVDLAHSGPVMLNEQLDKFQSQGYLTRLDFQNNWGTAEDFKDGLEGRAIRRGILALDEFYTAGNKKQGLSEVIWLSETPWSDFLRKHDTRVVGGEFGEIFGGSAIKLITYKPREGQFDGI